MRLEPAALRERAALLEELQGPCRLCPRACGVDRAEDQEAGDLRHAVERHVNEDRVREALDALTRCADTGEGNLLELSVKAARVRARRVASSTAASLPIPLKTWSTSPLTWAIAAPTALATGPRIGLIIPPM